LSLQEFASLGAAIGGVGVMLSMSYFSMEQSSSSFRNLSYCQYVDGAPEEIRTPDPQIRIWWSLN
jgi:hypothetical protein